MRNILTSLKEGSRTINVLLFITFLSFTFGQLGRLELFEIPVFGNVYELLLGISFLGLLIKIRLSKEILRHPIVKATVLFFSWLFITLLISLFSYNYIQNILAVLYFVRLVFYFFFFVYFYTYIKTYPRSLSFYVTTVIVVTCITILFSLVQYFLYPNIGNLAYQGWDPHLYRLVGLFFDPPVTAAIFVLLGLFILFSKLQTYVKVSFAAILGILFFLTYSRGGFLALFVTIAFYSLQKMKIRYIATFVLAALVVYVVIPKNISEGLDLTRTASIQTRLIDYNKAIHIWQKNPILGIGYNHIRAEKDRYEEKPIVEKYNPSHASASFHSSFLMILVTSGVIGLVFYMWLLWKIAHLNNVALYATVFLSVYSLTDNLLLHPFILFLLFTLISIHNRHQELVSA